MATMIETDAERAARELCGSCGLCCDGTLFSSVDVSEDEAPGIARASEGGRLKVLQPCPAHEGGCRVYADRPRSCREFRCAPLEAMESGAMTPAQAKGLLDRAKALSKTVRARIPGTGPLWRDVEPRITSAAWRAGHADLVLDIALLRELGRKIRDEARPVRP